MVAARQPACGQYIRKKNAWLKLHDRAYVGPEFEHGHGSLFLSPLPRCEVPHSNSKYTYTCVNTVASNKESRSTKSIMSKNKLCKILARAHKYRAVTWKHSTCECVHTYVRILILAHIMLTIWSITGTQACTNHCRLRCTRHSCQR